MLMMTAGERGDEHAVRTAVVDGEESSADGEVDPEIVAQHGAYNARSHARAWGLLTSASASIQSCAESSDAFPCLHASRCFSRPAPFCDASHPICLASAWRC